MNKIKQQHIFDARCAILKNWLRELRKVVKNYKQIQELIKANRVVLFNTFNLLDYQLQKIELSKCSTFNEANAHILSKDYEIMCIYSQIPDDSLKQYQIVLNMLDFDYVTKIQYQYYICYIKFYYEYYTTKFSGKKYVQMLKA